MSDDGGMRGRAHRPRAPDGVGRILAAVDRLSDWGAWASVACIAGILGLIVGEVAARNLLNKSIDVAWEFSAFLMGAAFMLGAAYSLRTGAQIRVMVLLDHVPPRMRQAIDATATICCTAVAGYLTCALGQLTWLSWVRDSHSDKASELPLWIAQLPLATGALLFTLQSAARLLRLLRGEPGEDVKLRVGEDAKAEAS
jgi:TRAP-type C4-dicarboxylate transport system permease small subunit